MKNYQPEPLEPSDYSFLKGIAFGAIALVFGIPAAWIFSAWMGK